MLAGTVLLVDDDIGLLKLFTLTLQHAGYDVTPAASLEEARAALDAARFDLLIIDMLVSTENGLMLLKSRAQSLMQKGTRIVAMSSDWSFQPHVIETGVHYFMVKPISPTSLIEVVRRVMQQNNSGGA